MKNEVSPQMFYTIIGVVIVIVILLLWFFVFR